MQPHDSTAAGTGPTADTVREALRDVHYPGLTRDIVSFGMVRHISVCGTQGKVQLAIRTPQPDAAAQLETDIAARLARLGITSTVVEIAQPEPTALPVQQKAPPDPWAGQARLATVKHVIAVGAGKGGVGKSTVALNLALALAWDGLRVGLLDADIYGPSLPILLGIEDGAAQAKMSPEKFLIPVEAHGIPLVSFGFFLGEGSPAVWRGPMVSKAVKQFARGVAWGDLDVLIVDLPPGTGDIPLSLAQSVELSGAIVVTQPTRVAAAEARKAVEMFRALEVPVLGVVENMTGAFGLGAGRWTSEALGVPFLGSIPFDAEMVGEGDAGTPTVVQRPGSETTRAFDAIATATAGALGWQKVAAES